MNIDELIQRMSRAAAVTREESIGSIAARIAAVRSLAAQARDLGAGAEMRARARRDELVSDLRRAMREAIREQGVAL